MTRAWALRSIEERTLLNPAYVGRIIRAGAEGHEQETPEGLPFPLAFLLAPIALHPATRAALPRSVSTAMPAWLEEHSFLRETFPLRARSIGGAVREGLAIALQSRLLELDHGRLSAPALPRTRPRRIDTEQTANALHRASFVGRWFANSGDVATIYALWGVKP